MPGALLGSTYQIRAASLVRSKDMRKETDTVAPCETCGNDCSRSMTVRHAYDSFDCVIHALASTCERCGIRRLGHGVESGDHTYIAARTVHAAPGLTA
jgi:hypothetical protein